VRAALLLMLILAGCANQQPVLGPTSQIGTFTAEDLLSAANVAKSAQEPVGGGCWSYLGPVVAALPANPGVATLIELKLLIGSGAFLGACGPVLPLLTSQPLLMLAH